LGQSGLYLPGAMWEQPKYKIKEELQLMGRFSVYYVKNGFIVFVLSFRNKLENHVQI